MTVFTIYYILLLTY